MRVLITGAAGFVGRHLAAHLSRTRAARGLGPAPVPAATLRASIRASPGRRPTSCSKRAGRSGVEQVRAEAVYHLASQSSVARSLNDPLPTMLNNVVGQVNLLEACAQHARDARILVVGSNEEYGLTRPDELPIQETKELRPISPYAVSKVTQDMLGHQYFVTHGLQIIRVRPFVHTGPGQASTFRHAGLRPSARRDGGRLQRASHAGRVSGRAARFH